MRCGAIVRRVDDLGRVVIPKSVRRVLGLVAGSALSFEADGDRITVGLSGRECVFCGRGAGLTVYRERSVCRRCLQAIRRRAAGGAVPVAAGGARAGSGRRRLRRGRAVTAP